jgi:hypothetical protein
MTSSSDTDLAIKGIASASMKLDAILKAGLGNTFIAKLTIGFCLLHPASLILEFISSTCVLMDHGLLLLLLEWEERSLVLLANYLLVGEAVTCANVVFSLNSRLACNSCCPVTNSGVNERTRKSYV